MFDDRKLLVTGGTGSIGSSICNYFKNNGCKEIFSTTTNLKKIKSDQDFIKFKELNLEHIEDQEIKANKFLDEGLVLISKKFL